MQFLVGSKNLIQDKMYCQCSCYSVSFALTFCNFQMLIMATMEQYQLAGDIDSLVFIFSNQGKTYNGTQSKL